MVSDIRNTFGGEDAGDSSYSSQGSGGHPDDSASAVDEERQSVFRTRHLTKIYDMGEVQVRALRDINLEFFASELAVLLGASGSGKSTLLNILGGLDTATEGEVFYREQNLTRASDSTLTDYRRRHVGFVFQFYNLIPSLTARENVAIVTEIAEDPMTPEESLELVDLGDRMDHFPAQLSGGQQQRVAIARAIAKRPAVLLCDEPTGALDSSTGSVVLGAIERVNIELSTTTLVITHNAVQAEMADRIVHLSDGQVSEIERNEHKTPAHELTW